MFNEAIRYFSDTLVLDPYFIPSRYMLAICYFSLDQYEKALRELKIVVDQSPKYQRNLYIIMALCYRKLDLTQKAIQIVIYSFQNYVQLEQGIQEFGNYYDGLVFKGRLEMKSENYSSAQNTLIQAIEMFPQRSQAYACLGDCYRVQNKLSEAVKNYESSVEIDIKEGGQRLKMDLMKLSVSLYESGIWDQAEKWVDELIRYDETSSEGFNLKGLILLKKKQYQESILCFEQAVKHNNSKSSVTKSLIEISKIKISQRDFYSAFHTLTRCKYLDVENEQLSIYQDFVEAVLNLMKRKYDDAQLLFDQLEKKQLPSNLLEILPSYRAYCSFSLSKFSLALEDYKFLLMDKQIPTQDRNSMMYNKYICEGILATECQEFSKALLSFDKSLQIFEGQRPEPEIYKAVVFVQMALQELSEEKKNGLLLKALSALTLSISISSSLPTPLYIRSIINGYSQNFAQALQDIDQAIDKCDENIASYFYVKALLLACYGDLKSAINEFGVCLGLDENYADVYIQRAKCNSLIKSTSQAFDDMEKFIQLKPLENNENLDKNIHLWAGNLLLCNNAFEDAYKAYCQSDVNELLTYIQKQNSSFIFIKNKAKCLLGMRKVQQCYQEIKILKQKVICSESELAAIEIDIECLKIFLAMTQQLKKENQEIETISFSDLVTYLNKILTNKKGGILFKFTDIYKYRGICYFHSQKYEQAINDFEKSLQLKEQTFKQRIDYAENEDSDQEFIKIFQLECSYNILLCWVMLKKFKYAMKQYEQLNTLANEQQIKRIAHLHDILQNEISNQNTMIFIPPPTFNPESMKNFLTVTLKKTKDEFCHLLPPVVVQAYTLNDKYLLYPSFDVPDVDPPEMFPVFDSDLIKQIKPQTVENKPEAPWIRRNNDGVIFTDNVQQIENLRLETEELEDKGEVQNQYDVSDEDFNTNKQFEVEKIKQNLKLDLDIENKLERILKGNKNN